MCGRRARRTTGKENRGEPAFQSARRANEPQNPAIGSNPAFFTPEFAAATRQPAAPYSSYGVYSGTRRFIAPLISPLMPESATTRSAASQPSSASATAPGEAFNR